MTRDFIFDAAGAVIGYRCRIKEWQACTDPNPNPACSRMFPTARGLWQHQRRAHGHQEQLFLYPVKDRWEVMPKSLKSKAKGAKKRTKAMDSQSASGLVSSSA